MAVQIIKVSETLFCINILGIFQMCSKCTVGTFRNIPCDKEYIFSQKLRIQKYARLNNKHGSPIVKVINSDLSSSSICITEQQYKLHIVILSYVVVACWWICIDHGTRKLTVKLYLGHIRPQPFGLGLKLYSVCYLK